MSALRICMFFQEPGMACPSLSFFTTTDEALQSAKIVEEATGSKPLIGNFDYHSRPMFEDLDFQQHPVRSDTYTAKRTFKNGYVASVLEERRSGQRFPSWEVAVLVDGKVDDRNPYIRGGIMSGLSASQVEIALMFISEFPPVGGRHE